MGCAKHGGQLPGLERRTLHKDSFYMLIVIAYFVPELENVKLTSTCPHSSRNTCSCVVKRVSRVKLMSYRKTLPFLYHFFTANRSAEGKARHSSTSPVLNLGLIFIGLVASRWCLRAEFNKLLDAFLIAHLTCPFVAGRGRSNPAAASRTTVSKSYCPCQQKSAGRSWISGLSRLDELDRLNRFKLREV